ncbi:MAG: hypothetical protein EOO11_10365 [Chitinophagaceae bacterium]|nr:MAG: hypothetical protein EOO11_10365 [Chitinophagaceae bacterium]
MDQLTTKTRLIPYRSPVRPVLHAGEPLQPFAATTLQRARKKLLAELALSNDELELDGLTYTRNDLAVLFQDLTESEWSGHCLIYSIPGFLQFLEQSRFDAGAMAPARQYHYKPGFTAFVSPWFAPAFRDASGRFLRDSEPLQLTELFRYADFIAPEDGPEAYERLRIYFDEFGFLLRNWTWEKMQEDSSRIACLFDPDWIAFLNALPDPLAPARDSVVEQFLGIVYRFQHKASWKLLQRMCAQLQAVRCNPELQAQVNEYEEIMRRNSSSIVSRRKSSDGSGGGFSFGRGAWAIVWIALMIIRAASSDSCNRPSSLGRLEYTPTYSSPESPVYTPEADQAASISNESHLRHTFLDLSANAHKGTPLEPKTGSAPFSGMSQEPQGFGPRFLTVRNNSSQDMVLFSYNRADPILDSETPVQAVFIGRGQEYELPIRPNQGYLNAVFGTGWVKLANPREVQLHRNVTSTESSGSSYGRDVTSTMTISEYFRTPSKQLQFLKRDLMVKDHPEYRGPDAQAKPVFEPEDRNLSVRGTLTFSEKGGKMAVKGSGGLYIYLSVERP